MTSLCQRQQIMYGIQLICYLSSIPCSLFLFPIYPFSQPCLFSLLCKFSPLYPNLNAAIDQALSWAFSPIYTPLGNLIPSKITDTFQIYISSSVLFELQKPNICLTIYQMSPRYLKYNLLKTKLVLSSLCHRPKCSASVFSFKK